MTMTALETILPKQELTITDELQSRRNKVES